ncbi:MAG: ATP-binding cassette domain-containing protein [Betaproteobacteria bacterium]|nr:ATP-binding cassette domain-containing protein [Betaproteobacteria bacterium]
MNARPAEASSLRLVDVRLERGSATLAETISFDLPDGRYIELSGPNGSGKSTLLRTLAGLQRRISLHSSWPHAHEVFLFEQNPALRMEPTAAAQLDWALEPLGTRLSAAERGIALQRVGLERAAGKRVGQLSEGQRRRLVLAVMAASQRRVWLIDEPVNALDGNGIRLFIELLREHLGSGGIAVIATHRPLAELAPDLATLCHTRVHLTGRSAEVSKVESDRLPDPGQTGAFRRGVCPQPALWALRRELALAMASPRELIWPGVFHWMILSLIPFGIGTDPQQLARIAPGMVWVSALLVTLLAAGRHLEADFRSGILSQLAAAGFPLGSLVAGKALAHWLLFGLPMAVYSVPLALQYGLDATGIGALALSLASGTPALGAFTLLFSALGLMARQAQVLVSLMSFPVFVPVLIFGATTVSAAQAGQSQLGPLLTLVGISLLALLLVPPAARRVLDLAVE